MSDTISILRGVQERYEVFHKIEINDEALIAAVELSHRYITDRRLPDKALDLIDEASSKLRLELDSVPDEVDKLQRKLAQLEMEREFLIQERNDNKEREIASEIAKVQDQLTKLKALWKTEKIIIDEIHGYKAEVEKLRHKINAYEKEEDFKSAAKIKKDELDPVLIKLEEEESKLHAIPEENRMTNEEVSPDDVADVVSRWTGIAVQKMQQSDKERLLNLESEIGKRLVGQKNGQ